jgi:hypothetical protein
VTLSLLESLFRQASAAPPSAELVRTLRTAVDTLLAGYARSGTRLSADERGKIAAAADLVREHTAPGAMDRWRTEIGRALEAMAS